jgi:hypothetical protein
MSDHVDLDRGSNCGHLGDRQMSAHMGKTRGEMVQEYISI